LSGSLSSFGSQAAPVAGSFTSGLQPSAAGPQATPFTLGGTGPSLFASPSASGASFSGFGNPTSPFVNPAQPGFSNLNSAAALATAPAGCAPPNVGPAFTGFGFSSGTGAAFHASAPLQDVLLARESVTNTYAPAHFEHVVPLGDGLQLVSCRVHSNNLCMYGFELGQHAPPLSGCSVTSVSPGGPAHLSGKMQTGQNLCVACLQSFRHRAF
jgi:hypothetical protein